MRYLIFGGSGSLGRELINVLLGMKHEVAIYSRDEGKHWVLKNEIANNHLSSLITNLQFYVGDMRDLPRVRDVIKQYLPDVIIIAAALKHVDTCELSPDESVKTNILGTQNVIDAINLANFAPDAVLFVSTDKACSPVNVYGMCKAISERIVTSQANNPRLSTTKFLAVRYGNVLESRGSIIPTFRYQGERGTQLTVTDREMTRFLMTLNDSVSLIRYALKHGKNGQILIPRVPTMKIGDLADIFAEKYNKPIQIIGLRPGEKLHEDLINESESPRAREIDDQHYVIDSAHNTGIGPRFTYTSRDNVLTKEQLKLRLQNLNFIDCKTSQISSPYYQEVNASIINSVSGSAEDWSWKNQ